MTFLDMLRDAQRRNRISLKTNWEASLLGFDRIEALLYGQDSETRQDTEQFRLADRTTPFESLRWRRFDFTQRDLGLDLLGMRSFSTGAAAHELLAGLELERTRYKGQRDGIETNLRTGSSSTVVLAHACGRGWRGTFPFCGRGLRGIIRQGAVPVPCAFLRPDIRLFLGHWSLLQDLGRGFRLRCCRQRRGFRCGTVGGGGLDQRFDGARSRQRRNLRHHGKPRPRHDGPPKHTG